MNEAPGATASSPAVTVKAALGASRSGGGLELHEGEALKDAARSRLRAKGEQWTDMRSAVFEALAGFERPDAGGLVVGLHLAQLLVDRVEEPPAPPRGEADLAAMGSRGPVEVEGDVQGLRAAADDLRLPRGPRRNADAAEHDGLHQGGLPGPVRADDHHQPGGQVEGRPVPAADVADLEAPRRPVGAAPAGGIRR